MEISQKQKNEKKIVKVKQKYCKHCDQSLASNWTGRWTSTQKTIVY